MSNAIIAPGTRNVRPVAPPPQRMRLVTQSELDDEDRAAHAADCEARGRAEAEPLSTVELLLRIESHHPNSRIPGTVWAGLVAQFAERLDGAMPAAAGAGGDPAVGVIGPVSPATLASQSVVKGGGR